VSKAFKQGSEAGQQHLQTAQIDQTSLQEYLAAGYLVAMKQLRSPAGQDKFMLGWWYQGYPFFGLMRVER